MDGAPACPFVAFGDDRDARATSPDHRHRCFAETPPAPRALAHQEAYCLSSAFPVCPTFQDWARREAAQARADEIRAEPSMGAAAGAAAVGGIDDDDEDVYPPPSRPAEPPPVRNPPRDWAAPPPWATSPGTQNRPGSSAPTANELLAGKAIQGQGLAGSAADQLAGGAPPAAAAAAWSASGGGAAATPADDELAGLVGSHAGGSGGPGDPAGVPPVRTPAPSSAARPAVSSTRPPTPSAAGPSWERPRRYEAYPAIKTRASLPGLPRLAVLAGAVGIAALALFMLPALLGIGGPGASPSPSTPVATATPQPTAPPAPTPQVYVIKKGDTLSKVARRFGLTLDELLAANKDTIKNPDQIAIGDEIIIPLPASLEEPSEEASSAAPASVAP
jgi:nucleoid-associated protein YgaU